MISREEWSSLRLLCRGVLEDGKIDDSEAHDLKSWLRQHPDIYIAETGRRLCDLIERSLRDGVLEVDERIELEDLLEQVAEI